MHDQVEHGSLGRAEYEVALSIATTLGTLQHSFPQTYLRLPLSPTKLPPSAYQMLLDRFNYYLAG
jgi:hypothetical protein